MKNCYPIVVLLLLSCQLSFAQKNQANSLVFGNQFYLDAKNITGTSDADAQDIADQASPQLNSHYKTAMNKMAGLKKQQQMMVPSTGTNYDVKYYRLNLRINPDTSVGKYVRGNVTIYFTTGVNNFSVANFDMATALASDSVYYHGAKLAGGNINRATANLIAITIPNIPVAGTLDSLTIYYKGVPPVTAGFSNGTGYVKATHGSPSQNYVYTLSEPYSSFSWWPCKSFIVGDKADSMDMIVSTPTTFKVASNGTLVYERVKGSNNLETYWKERYPISAYQVCVGVANYVQYPTVADTVVIGGTKMPVFNYLFPETNTAASQTSLDRVKLMLTTYSSLYGDYPFKNEKYGNYSFGFGGGMEHNTFSGECNTGVYNVASYWDILAHELAHQWWGANVTCASWQDIWVNESFADFSEALVLEFAPSIGTAAGNTALSWRATKKSNSINASYQAKTTYVTDTSDILTIFTPSVYIYDRGGMIITMMRTLLGDTKFFQAVKNYQSDPKLKGGNAFTADVKRHMEAVSGIDLTAFFNNWMYNTGYASYSGSTWNNFGNTIVLSMTQSAVSSGISHFDMPIPVRIQGAVAGQDTTIIVWDKGGHLYYVNNGNVTNNYSTNTVQYTLSFTPTTVTFDAFSQVLATGSFTKNGSLVLDTKVMDFSCVKDNGNVNVYWSIDNSFDYNSFEIERSADGVSFQKFATVKAADNQNVRNFLQTDYTVPAGTWYYRIKVIQKSGAVVYTNIIPVTITDNSGLYTISPNPAKDVITITSKEKTGKVDISLFNAAGNLVGTFKDKQLNGPAVKLVVSNLAPGTYFIKINKPGEEVYTKSIVIIP